jgi:hypothetical protein
MAAAPESMSRGQLALHVATVPDSVAQARRVLGGFDDERMSSR